MNSSLTFNRAKKIVHAVIGGILALTFVACGGGGGSPGLNPNTTTTTAISTGTTTTLSLLPTAAIDLVDSITNISKNSVSGSSQLKARATIKDAAGKALANVVVHFSSSNSSLVQFDPVSASALTDGNGVAVVNVYPAGINAIGALTIIADASVGTAAVTASVSMSVGGAPIPPGPTAAVDLIDATTNISKNFVSSANQLRAQATIRDGAGKPIPNVVVKFTASDVTLIQFIPSAATALTDATGLAVVNIQPTGFNSVGALTVRADATIGLSAVTASTNLSVGAAPLTIGTLSFTPTPIGILPPFSATILNVPVTSAGQAVTTAPGLTLTSLCAGDGLASVVPGNFVSGVLQATYTNKGCLRGFDVITAAIGNSSQSIAISVASADIGTIQFVGSDLTGTSIVLKGSGGLGRKESAVLTFKLVDQNNIGLAGVKVDFSATTTTGGLTVLPTSATTDASGNVTTTVSSGTIPTPVRVIAQATRNGKVVNGLSDALTISTGLPIQKSMSMGADSYNIEGLGIDGEVSNITVRLADQYGNKIADNTTVNFIAEGGVVGSSAQGACNTLDGGCTVKFQSQEFRPVNGRVTVLAYVQGLEDFVDSNGDGQYSCSGFVPTNGVAYRPLVDVCPGGGEPFTDLADPFLDAGSLAVTRGAAFSGTLDGVYNPANGDLPVPYNSSAYSSTGNGKWGLNYLRRSVEIVLSGSVPYIIRMDCTTDPCTDSVGNKRVIDGLATTVASPGPCGPQTLYFRLVDVNNNPLPFNTIVGTSDADKLSPGTMSPNLVMSMNLVGGTTHSVKIKPDSGCASGSFAISVKSPKGATYLDYFFSN